MNPINHYSNSLNPYYSNANLYQTSSEAQTKTSSATATSTLSKTPSPTPSASSSPTTTPSPTPSGSSSPTSKATAEIGLENFLLPLFSSSSSASSERVAGKKRSASNEEESEKELTNNSHKKLKPSFRESAGSGAGASAAGAGSAAATVHLSPLKRSKEIGVLRDISSRVLQRRGRLILEPEKSVRKPQIIKFPTEVSTHMIYINGVNHSLNRMGEGQSHIVYEFVGEGGLEIHGKQHQNSSIVLKSVNVNKKGPNQVPKLNSEAIANYKSMLAEGLPVPKVFLFPDETIDTQDAKNGGFWIIEKMKRKISCNAWKSINSVDLLSQEDKRVLEFVRGCLTQSATESREVINDFYPRNVMINFQDTPCIVDFSEAQNDEWEINLFGYLIAWSNGNEVIWNWLIAKFPEATKETMMKILAEKKAENSGSFPISKSS